MALFSRVGSLTVLVRQLSSKVDTKSMHDSRYGKFCLIIG